MVKFQSLFGKNKSVQSFPPEDRDVIIFNQKLIDSILGGKNQNLTIDVFLSPPPELTLGQVKQLFTSNLEIHKVWYKHFPLHPEHSSDKILKDYILLKLLQSSSNEDNTQFLSCDVYGDFLLIFDTINSVLRILENEVDFIEFKNSSYDEVRGLGKTHNDLSKFEKEEFLETYKYLNEFSNIPHKNITLSQAKDIALARYKLEVIMFLNFPLHKNHGLFTLLKELLPYELLNRKAYIHSNNLMSSEIYPIYSKLEDILSEVISEDSLLGNRT